MITKIKVDGHMGRFNSSHTSLLSSGIKCKPIMSHAKAVKMDLGGIQLAIGLGVG